MTNTSTVTNLKNTPDVEAFWMPFTTNRKYKQNPLLIEGAGGMYYQDADGRKILDAIAGLWCVNAGHNHPKIVQAIQQQADILDYAPSFQIGHPKAFELATRLAELTPGDLNRVFFTNSGSEAVDTALKIALAYHHQKGEGQRTHLIGRARSYHGVGFGGLSVAGIGAQRKAFGPLLPGIGHLPHTHNLDKNAFSRGIPKHGAELADTLEDILQTHDPSTVAAVIVEPVAGSTGVLVPPKGYLQKLRGICDKHGILLIFDEVITGFGRLGANFASDYFDVLPDIITCAKGMTNGAIPMGSTIVREEIYQAFMTGSPEVTELLHGYTYSGHPLGAVAGLATLDVHAEEGLTEKAHSISGYFEEAVHSLKGSPSVIDIRNIGLLGAVELEPGGKDARALSRSCVESCYEVGVMIRSVGNTLVLSPPLIVTEEQIDITIEAMRSVLKQLG